MGIPGEHRLSAALILISAIFVLFLLLLPPAALSSGDGLPEAPGPEESTLILPNGAEGPEGGRIGIQAGHWRAEELPDSMAELRSSTGAQARGLREVDVNLQAARLVVDYLKARNIPAELLPATIPPGYRADAVVSLHADWGSYPGRRGWKTSPPWRPSAAALFLEGKIRESFIRAQIPEDRDGITVNMRGYYGFNHRYYTHAIAEDTPAVLVEMGFLTNDLDRILLTDGIQKIAEIIGEGVMEYWKDGEIRSGESRKAPDLPPARVGSQGGILRDRPQIQGSRRATLLPGQRVFQLQKNSEGWVEVFVREPRAETGWVLAADLVP